MDNDDNDYDIQGLSLAGEESSKISPVLRTYALPKFDFDEGHLRFDTLVENEVFLGIPSQEDNQWIDDFPRGSSGIEFSSSAADSCSIPRHNNVWSEATSSESVEMLLKSVGQEEMVPGESIIEEPNAGDELPSLTKQMDPNLSPDDKADEVKGPTSELPPLRSPGSISALNQNPTGEDGRCTCISQPPQVDPSVDGCSGNTGEKTSITVTEENLHVELKCTEENVGKDPTSLSESLNRIQEDSSSSVVETERAQCISSDSIAMTGKPDILDKVSDISHESTGSLPEERCNAGDLGNENSSIADDEKLIKSSAETSFTDLHSSIHASSKVEVMAESAIETTTVNIGRLASMPTKGNSNIPMIEGCNKLASSLEPSQHSRSELVAFAEGMEIPVQSETENLSLEKPSEASEVGGKGLSTEVCNSSSNAGCAELNKQSEISICQGRGRFMEGFACSGMQIQSTESSEHGENHVDDCVMTQKSVSIGSVGEEAVNGGLKNGDYAAGLHNDDSKAKDLVSPAGPTVSSDIGREVSSKEGVQDCNQVLLNQERGSGNLSFDPSNINTESDTIGLYKDQKKLGLASLDPVSEENVKIIDGSELDALVGNEPASDARVEGTNPGSRETVHVVPSLPLSDAIGSEICGHNDEQKRHPFAVETLPSDENEGMETEVPRDASVSSLEPGDVTIKDGPDSVATKEVPDAFAAEVVSGNNNQSANMVESSNRTIHVEQVGVEASKERSDTFSDSNLRSDGAESADLLRQNESLADKDQVNPTTKGVENSSEIEKPNTASAPIVSDTGHSPNEIENQAGNSESIVGNPSISCSTDGVVSNVSSASVTPCVKDATEEERSFTFDVSPSAGLPVGEPTKGWQSVPSTQANKISKLVEKPASTSGSTQIDPELVQEVPRGSHQKHDKRVSSGGPKTSSERKTRRSSGRSGKENARNGNHAKETTPARQIEKADALSVFLSPSGMGKLMQLEVGSVECSGKKPSGVVSLSGSSLPDLNTSASTSVLFRQPFTDLQQLQLRAQIFVYGSLIQGAAPDEACMVSAFGISDGGRSIWEPAWRACMERFHGQKSHLNSSETTVQSCSASDHANKQGLSQSKVRASSKSTPSPVVNPMIPLSSPLWNISTPSCDALPTNNMARGAVLDYQALSPLHAFQTPGVRNFSGHTTSWLSQGPFPVPWVASSQSSPFDINTHFSALPTTETVKLTPAKESSLAISTIQKHAPPITVGHGRGSSVTSGASSMHDLKKVTESHAPYSAEPKSKKRKKASTIENVSQIALPVNQTESVSAPVTNNHFANKGPALEDLRVASLLARSQSELMPTSLANIEFANAVSIPTPSSFGIKSNSDKSLAVVSSIALVDHPRSVDLSLDKRALGVAEIAKVEEARIQAEEAAAHAAVAVNNCQTVWSQLNKQKNTGLMSDVETKLASAAAAIAAATSVAKAAAAAAEIASNAAVQAKLMADEALISYGNLNPIQTDGISLTGFVNSMANATSTPVLKVSDGSNGSNSVILAARRRIDTASAASRHAENLDAVVKAAEMAAEAVSQAGKIVALGDPLPLSKLVEAGPERYWKVSELLSNQGVKSTVVTRNIPNSNSLEEVLDVRTELSERPSDKEMHATGDCPLHPRVASTKLSEDHFMQDEILASVIYSEKDVRGPKSRRASDLSKTISVVPESDIDSRSNANENTDSTAINSHIKENCLVEVFKDNSDFPGAWFSANVLSLKDGKALVCYTELESDEGKLKEWVPLEADGRRPPILRLAHPVTNVMFEGTRKRRRAAARDYTWSLGDRVDAWMGNCWREGVIVEKNKKDETTLSVHFPALEKTTIVKAWHLRMTLLWKDGEWIECSSSGQDYSSQGEAPQEKRLKLGSPATEGKGKGKMPKNMDLSESRKLEESRSLALSATEKMFNIGSTKNESKPENLRTMRSGLQKEGSKVIFGVPKPGKKRKFMEVSKHYDSDRSGKNNASADSEKFAKYLMPQGSGPRAWKNNSKIDSKEKLAAESKIKGVKAGKPLTVSTRTLFRKDNSVMPSTTASRGATLTDNLSKNGTSTNENDSGQQNLNEFLSSSNVEEGAEDSMLLSTQIPLSNAPKKMATSNAKSERLRKGKLAPAGGKLTKVKEKEKSLPEVVEPRRSNRRIQPTSRLLEGLQSSLIISKIPSVPNDKSHKSQNRGVSKGNNN